MSRRLVLIVSALVALGCGAPVDVIVDLVTDWEPEVDFDTVRTTLTDEAGRSLGEASFRPTGDGSFAMGTRVAELRDVPRGVYTLELQLLAGTDVVARRQRTVAVSGTLAVTLELRRPPCTAEPETCNGIDDDCDREIDEGADVCALDGASGSSCVDGACRIDACAADRGDCDGDAANGCEAELASDAAHCGACGAACEEGYVCERGECRGRGLYLSHAQLGSPVLPTYLARPGGGFLAVSSSADLSARVVEALDQDLSVEWSSTLETSTGFAPSAAVFPRADGTLLASMSLNAGRVVGESATHDFGAGPLTIDPGTSRHVLVAYDPLGAYLEHRWLPGSETGATSTSSASVRAADDGGAYVVAGTVSTGGEVDPGAGPITGPARYLAAYDAGHALLWSHQLDVATSSLHWTELGRCQGEDTLAVVRTNYTPVHTVDFGAGEVPISAEVEIAVRYGALGEVRWYAPHRGHYLALRCLEGGDTLELAVAPSEGGGGTLVRRRSPDGELSVEHELPFRDDRLGDDGFPVPCTSTCVQVWSVVVSPWGDLDLLVGVGLPVDFGGGRRAPVFDGAALASYAPDGSYRYDRLWADPGTVSSARLAVSGRDQLILAAYRGEVDLGPARTEGEGWVRLHLRD